MDCSTISKVPGRLGMVWQAQKFFGEAFLHYQLDLFTLEFLSILTDKNLRIEVGGVNVGALARKLRVCGHILVWRTHSCRLFKYFRYTLCKPSVRTSQTTQSVPLNLREVPVCVVKSQICIIKVIHMQHKFSCSFYRQHVSALFWAIIALFIRTLTQEVKTTLRWRSPFYIKIHY